MPVADVVELGRRAVDERGHPVAVAVDDLRADADDRRDVGHGGALAGDGLGVLRRERDGGAGAEAYAAAGAGAGLN